MKCAASSAAHSEQGLLLAAADTKLGSVLFKNVQIAAIATNSMQVTAGRWAQAVLQQHQHV